MANNYIQCGDIVDWTNNTGVAVLSGKPVVIGNQQMGIALTDIANLATGSVAKEGVFSLPKNTSTAINQGQKLWWNASSKEIIAAPIINSYFIGFADKSELISSTTVNVDLEEFSEEGSRCLTLAATGTQTLNIGDFGSADLIVLAPNTAIQTINLPSVTTIPAGSKLFVKKTDATAAAITLDPNASETIAGASTYTTIATNNALGQFISNGSSWQLMWAA